MRLYYILGLIFFLALIPNQTNLQTNYFESRFKNGCCYSVNFGSIMEPKYGDYSHKQQEDCLVSERIGGATRYSNLTCNKLKKIHKLIQNKNL